MRALLPYDYLDFLAEERVERGGLGSKVLRESLCALAEASSEPCRRSVELYQTLTAPFTASLRRSASGDSVAADDCRLPLTGCR
ncbi:hypothetical protein L1987_21073 [Smallanthus sonchifolius]|uniref:Uncharacterized protein n=2 Tax=Smallanthus sonchifolius TaxID=185202 RepID=A0ACB9IU36_9ASTR|nr:hypothetical protein L1987_21070 [Smallanthus sonchifolius]KAI3811352.1 hypothetical protein L1987_21073 [Smallanthus sonchifolius]